MSTQLQRCGGSLLTQLFDNHPNVLSHPWEVMIYKEGGNDLYAQILKTQKEFKRLTINGYKKGKHSKKKHRFYFLYDDFAEKLFEIREDNFFLNLYFDEFFKYWINYKNDIDKKKLITGFSPFFCKKNLCSTLKKNKRMNIIHIYRDPISWWASAKNFKEKYKHIEAIEVYWKKSQEEIIFVKKKIPERVFIINFEDLIKKRKKVMSYLCKKFSITFNNNLMSPTFNGDKIDNNSTFKNQKIDRFGIIKDINKSRSKLLNNNEKQIIKLMTNDVVFEISKFSENFK